MKNNTRVLASAVPLSLEGKNGKAVLVLHGYNGYPTEMYGLARRIHAEGYTVAVPRLPGHATNAADFRKSNWKLWHSHIRNEYMNLQSRFESVTVVGLSMGGVLALLAAAEFNPEKVILLAPAMDIRQKIVYFTHILKYFIPKIDRKREPEADADEDRLYMEREYWSTYYTAQLASFRKLMMMARRRLSDVICPVYYMLSEKDSTVPLEAGAIIERGVRGPVTSHTLTDSPHVFFEGPENDFVLDKIVEWLN